MRENIFFLGVEGGATKGKAILANEEGKIVEENSGSALNYHNVGKERAEKNLIALIRPLLATAKNGKTFAVFGFAGFETKEDGALYGAIAKRVLPKNAVFQVVNDAQAALEAKCPGFENRIMAISGTGSTVVGESGKKRAKSIGWGEILGDEGSGYLVGLKVMKAAVRSWDGRGEKTLFEKLVLRRTGTKTMEDFIAKVYAAFQDTHRNVKSYIASFAPLIDEALKKGDKEAVRIRKETSEELLLGAKAVVRRLGLEKKEFCLGCTGSGWNMPRLHQMFRESVKKEFPMVQFSERKESGAWGAVQIAKRLNNKTIKQ